jgi:hypothetical protein
LTDKGCEQSSVVLANNEERKVVGICRVKFKMFDRIVEASSNIGHVVELERNLISLGQLDALGYGYSKRSRLIKVNKGALVVMKREKA